MPRSYSVRLVAFALDCDRKWLDNLLSHYALPGVARGKQGVERRVSDDGLLAIEATRIFASELGVPLSQAVRLARRTIEHRDVSEEVLTTPSGLSLRIPFRSLEARLRQRLVVAIEALGQVARGRPPSRANLRT